MINDEVKKAWNLFLEHVQKSSEVRKLMKAVGNGTATYAEALEYSSLLSKLLVESASEVYPNDSQKVLGMLKNAQYCRNYFNHVDKPTPSYVRDTVTLYPAFVCVLALYC